MYVGVGRIGVVEEQVTRLKLADRHGRARQRLVGGDPRHHDARLARTTTARARSSRRIVGPAAPHTYGRPRRLIAALSIASSTACGDGRLGRLAGAGRAGAEPAAAAAEC